MRIDYSPPKQSCVTGQSKPRPRKEPAGKFTSLIVVTGLIAFTSGFGSGWFFSQQSAKRAFQAAAEQNSIENAPKPATVAPLPTQPKPEPVQMDIAPPQPATAIGGQAVPGAKTTPDPQLSFYKTLPSDQKTNFMGSGVNAKGEKEKQPLQAAIPSNIARKPQAPAKTTKPVNEKPAATADKSATATREKSGFTVQVVSCSLKSEAEAVKNKLAGKGYGVTISESNQGDKGIWYRVRVGKRLEQDAAKELAGKLGKGAIVIPERE
jgi:hypothetical protein